MCMVHIHVYLTSSAGDILLTYSAPINFMEKNPSWEDRVIQVVKPIYGTWRFIARLTKVHRWSLSSAWWIQSTSFHSVSLISTLILSSHISLVSPFKHPSNPSIPSGNCRCHPLQWSEAEDHINNISRLSSYHKENKTFLHYKDQSINGVYFENHTHS